MAFKLKTSKQTEEIFDRIEASENLPWYTLARISIALSIRAGRLEPKDYESDSLGRELNRQTITGDADSTYKCFVQLQEGKHLADDDFFPRCVKAHLDRGAQLLERDNKYTKNLLVYLAEPVQGI